MLRTIEAHAIFTGYYKKAGYYKKDDSVTCGLFSDFQKYRLVSQYFKHEVGLRQPALHLNTGLARHPVMGKYALLKNLIGFLSK